MFNVFKTIFKNNRKYKNDVLKIASARKENKETSSIEKPLAQKSIEEHVKNAFNFDMDPEEYVARYSHTFGSSSLDEYSYRDKNIERWIYKMHKVIWDSFNGKGPSIDEIRRKYLTEDEIKRIKEDAEEF